MALNHLYDVFLKIFKTLKVNNFVSADFQIQLSIWLLVSMKFCTVINVKDVQKSKTRVYWSTNWPQFTGGQNPVLKLNPLNRKIRN